ncbi:MAG: hypothetical protein AAF985_08420, partial [Bacteroidota bacterium]
MKMPLFRGAIPLPQTYLYALCFLLLSPHSLWSQSDPCACGHRWQAGGKWVSGTIDDYADQSDVPLGIGRFVKDKET